MSSCYIRIMLTLQLYWAAIILASFHGTQFVFNPCTNVTSQYNGMYNILTIFNKYNLQYTEYCFDEIRIIVTISHIFHIYLCTIMIYIYKYIDHI